MVEDDRLATTRADLADERQRAEREGWRAFLLQEIREYGWFGIARPGTGNPSVESQHDWLVEYELQAVLPPGCPAWDEANREFARRWVLRWSPAFGLARIGEALEDIRSFDPAIASEREMHSLFVGLLDDRPTDELAEQLAKVRRECEGDKYQIREDPIPLGTGSLIIGARYALSDYFFALARSLLIRWGMVSPNPSATSMLSMIPALDIKSGRWLLSRHVAGLLNIGTETLANYRWSGEKSADGLAGIDVRGRPWRKANKNTQAYYLRSALEGSGQTSP